MNEKIYKTGLMNDPALTDRLYECGATFTKDIDQQAAERRDRDRADVLELAAGREAAQVDDPVRHAAADQTDDEF